jgi:dihydroneopterin aldolase
VTLTIELAGLELHGHHGVEEDERRDGQRFLFDLWLDVPDAPARSDRIEDAVDYREVVATVAEVSGGRAYRLLEALATAVAEALLARFPLEQVRVRVRKPDVRLDAPVDYSAVTCRLPAPREASQRRGT